MEQEKNVTKKDSKILLYVIISLNIITILTMCICLYFATSNKISELTPNEKNEENKPVFEETIPEPTIVYTLKEYNGKIGVYQNEALIYTLDRYVFTLPEKDKKLLDEGIKLSSIEELYMVLEEYY